MRNIFVLYAPTNRVVVDVKTEDDAKEWITRQKGKGRPEDYYYRHRSEMELYPNTKEGDERLHRDLMQAVPF